jgi:hypothetical protein
MHFLKALFVTILSLSATTLAAPVEQATADG